MTQGTALPSASTYHGGHSGAPFVWNAMPSSLSHSKRYIYEMAKDEAKTKAKMKMKMKMKARLVVGAER